MNRPHRNIGAYTIACPNRCQSTPGELAQKTSCDCKQCPSPPKEGVVPENRPFKCTGVDSNSGHTSNQSNNRSTNLGLGINPHVLRKGHGWG
mmetsp:Transcript_23585/g.65457  ORF Transcript_23585/g.65457 Transcript_23585/m.65457 type:complete len:92 (-) Transcript_23585:208-483(-)